MNSQVGLELRVTDILKQPVLVSREAAHKLRPAIAATLAPAETPNDPATAVVTLDFTGVCGVAPSFADELVRIVEDLFKQKSPRSVLLLTFKNVPMRLSSKFAAIARGHELVIEETSPTTWEFRSGRKD
jgi:hypothetical protein